MPHRTLGRTGIKVSPYALGTLMFATSVGNPDHDDSIRIIHKALDAGINLVDTDDLVAGIDITLTDEILDRIDEIVPPGTDTGTLDQAYEPPTVQETSLRRRPLTERSGS